MKFRIFIKILPLAILLCAAGFASAQEDEGDVRDELIDFGMTVSDAIGDRLIFDFYRFNAFRGDEIRITMTGMDGLAPLIGLSDGSREVFARSDLDENGAQLPDVAPNGTATLALTIQEDGQYIIIATRVGNEAGETTGAYTLTLQLELDSGGADLQAVTFRCGEAIGTTATTLEFGATDDTEGYRLSVYGIDGFDPIIHARIAIDTREPLETCSDDSQNMHGDIVMLDGETYQFIETADASPAFAAQYGLRGGQNLGVIELAIGSVDAAPGTFIAVLDGFKITDSLPEVFLDVRLGPLARSTALRVYMVKVGNNRLDPQLTQLIIVPDQPSIEIICDDAGVRECASTPSIAESGVVFNDGLEVLGGPFDAGLTLAPEDIERMTLIFNGQNRNATGEFAIVLIGALPPRDNP